MTMTTATQWVSALGLIRHPEGGWYRETYRATESIAREHLPPRFAGPRVFSTTIYYLLESGDYSALHRIRQDEGWHFYDGSPLQLELLSPQGEHSTILLGRDPVQRLLPQAVAPTGWLFGATTTGDYSLLGCTVAPGFDFADFEMPSRAELLSAYPQHADLITRLSR